MFITRIVLPVSLIVVIAWTANAWLNAKKTEQRTRSAKEDMESVVTDAVEVQSLKPSSAFEEFLQRSNDRQLIEYSRQISNSESEEPIPQKIEKILQRIGIANQLEDQYDSRAVLDFAASSKMKALYDREVLCFAPELFNDIGSATTIETVVDYFDASSYEAVRFAHLAYTTAIISRYLNQDSYNKTGGSWKIAKDSFELVANKLVDDAVAADQLYRLLPMIQENGNFEATRELVQLYSTSFANSNSVAGKNYAKKTKILLDQQQLELVEVPAEPKSIRKQNISELLAQIENLLNENKIDSSNVSLILNQIQNLIAMRETEASAAIADMLLKKMTNNLEESVLETLSKYQSWSETIGTPLNFDGLVDLNNSPVAFSETEDLVRVMVFISQERYRDSVFKFREINQLIGRLVLEGHISMAVVYSTDNYDASKNLNDMFELASKYDQLGVWVLPRAAAESKSINRLVPKQSEPCVIFLNQRNQVLAIDPSTETIQEILTATFQISAEK